MTSRSPQITIFTIGFTKTSAESFFARLKTAGVRRLIDVRLNNVSQLSGFAKRDDLRYFLDAIAGISYVHRPELAPTKELLDAYRRHGTSWEAYEQQFLELMAERGIGRTLSRDEFDGACVLCSEDTAERCHRRLVAEHLQSYWGDVAIKHL